MVVIINSYGNIFRINVNKIAYWYERKTDNIDKEVYIQLDNGLTIKTTETLYNVDKKIENALKGIKSWTKKRLYPNSNNC